jgi:hypothetical protein
MHRIYVDSRAHLDSVNETYRTHGWEALKIAAALATALVAVLIHAVVPGLCTHTASDTADVIVKSRRAREAQARDK